MAVNLAPCGNDAPFVDANGNPLTGGQLFTYTAGSSTKQNTYTTSAGNVANANPILLNSNGYPVSGGNVVEIWLTAGVSYKFVLAPSTDSDPPANQIWTRDNISGINDVTQTAAEWVSGPAPIYISATQFSLVGDQTGTFTVGRRVRTTNSGGTIYSTITVSAFTTITTVTVVNDSGTLDSGISAVSYGIINAVNPSTPDVHLSTFTTAGDIAQATGAGAVARLGIGTARQIPAVNAGATALAYLDQITLGTQQASTSGTSIDFTGIPAAVKRITIMFVGVSISGTSDIIFQIGDAGGIENTGYLGSGFNIGNAGTAAVVRYTAGWGIPMTDAASVLHGAVTLTLEKAAAFTWVAAGNLSNSAGGAVNTMSTSGSKSTSAELTQVRITTANGSDTFDAGVINISYE